GSRTSGLDDLLLETGQPAPDGAQLAGQGIPFRSLLLLPGQQTEAALVVLHGVAGAPDEVVDRGPRGLLGASDLGERPVAAQGQLEDLPLMVGQEHAVPLEQPDLALAGPKHVKAHGLTGYPPP